ncbi:MAG: Ig-like domain-containing protein [Thermoleophilia bacterium]
MELNGISKTNVDDAAKAGTGDGKTTRGKLKKFSFMLLLAGTLFALIAVTGCGNGTEAGTSNGVADTGGRLQLTETTFDAGTVPVGQKVEHKFTITNTGTGPLKMGQMGVKRLEGC